MRLFLVSVVASVQVFVDKYLLYRHLGYFVKPAVRKAAWHAGWKL